MVASEIEAFAAGDLVIVGFLDDDPALVGGDAHGYKVLGASADLQQMVDAHGVEEAIISVPSASREFVRRVVGLCRDAGIAFRIVPGIIEIIKGVVRIDQIRSVHPEDLLGRETVEFDESAIRKEISGRRVLVTGAGGSIGGEICRQVARFEPAQLLLLGRGENQIYEIEREIRTEFPELDVKSIIGDIRDAKALARTFKALQPNFVYHAAAHKHVHYMEAFPDEAVKNNIVGTANVIAACRAAGATRLVMLSTDKAVRPEGVMGATKRIAEFLMADANGADGLSCISVRFGNVLGSRGSVVPLFMRQIRDGGPVTVSDERATRFFMTQKEACMLVVQASVLGKGGEIFILKMGDQIRIAEMARDLIALHGLRPNEDIEIRITGLREGEKLHEDLVVDGEPAADAAHDKILASSSSLPPGWQSGEVLERFEQLAGDGDIEEIRRYLAELIPDARFDPSQTKP